jgi:alanyl-tRNA synthetase
MLSTDLVEKGLHTGNWLKQVVSVAGGGGRPDLAHAGGKNPEKIAEAGEQAGQAFSGKNPEKIPQAIEQADRTIKAMLKL